MNLHTLLRHIRPAFAAAAGAVQQRADIKFRLRRREVAIVLIACLLTALAPAWAKFSTDEGSASSSSYYRPDGAGAIEQAETNFPGSAFYYLDPIDDASGAGALSGDYPEGVDGAALGLDGDFADMAALENGQVEHLPGVGAVARPFRISKKGQDYTRALRCLTDAIYYEAATEPDVGQRAVAQVILNRVRHPSYPSNVCGVIYQGSERRTGCQFSYSCDGSMRRTPSKFHWARARRVAEAALSGSVYGPAGLATHYHTTEVHPYWAPSLNYIGTIGAHRFYTFKGKAGTSGAFFRRYAGSEPFPGPKPRAHSPSPSGSSDPVSLQRDFEREYAEAKARAEAAAKSQGSDQAGKLAADAPAPVGFNPDKPQVATRYDAPSYSAAAKARGGEAAFSGSNLPGGSEARGSGSIKAKYSQSGSWKQ